jgi:ABC-type uncharacterized transport system involved in gliding motility auxiliary subunit
MLDKLEAPITIRFYATRSRNEMPMFLKAYSEEVEDLLTEYELASKFIQLEKLDPEPDTPAEEAAAMDGVNGQPIDAFTNVYLGVAVECLGEKEAISYLNPQLKDKLEYDLTRMIYRVTNPEQLKVGIMSSLPVMGSTPPQANPMMPPAGGSEPWYLVTFLKKDYAVEEVATDVTEIPEDVNVLVVIHPKDLSESTQYAIDQFVVTGGKAIVLVDPYMTAEEVDQSNPMAMYQHNPSSNLEALLKTWGLEYDPKQIAADNTYAWKNQGQKRPEIMLMAGDGPFNRDEILTSSLDRVNFLMAGVLKGDGADGLTKTVLIHTSPNSDSFTMDEIRGSQGRLSQQVEGDEPLALAVSLSGKFMSAFPDGPPASDEVDTNDADDASEDAKVDSGHVAKGETDTSVLVIADADFVHHSSWTQEARDMFGRAQLQQTAENVSLIQNAVEQMGGDSSLIGIRSRGVTARPLTEIEKLEAEAEAAFQSKFKGIQDQIDKLQKQINEEGIKFDPKKGLVVTEAQKEQITKIREKQAEAKKELRHVRKDLRAAITAKQTSLTWLNILGVPVVVALLGLIVAFIRSRRMAIR